MFGPLEGLVWMTKGAIGAWYQDESISPGADRAELKKEQEKNFYRHIYLDVAAKAKENPPAPSKKHPRTEYAVGGAQAQFEKITILYGKEAGAISRTHVLHQDGGLFNKPETEAYLVLVPMPEPEERVVWLDLTYGVRGVYFPFSFDLPWPYGNLVQLPERDLLPAQVEKAGLEIMPERSVVDGVLHPVLQNTTRFKKKIFGEKEMNSDGKPSEERLFEDADTNPSTKKAKADLKKWLEHCTGKGPKQELERAQNLDALAKKQESDANMERFRQMIHPDRKKISTTDDELMGMPSYSVWTHEDLLYLLSSPGGQPDCLVMGHEDFVTEPDLGLGLKQPETSIRIDVREVMCCLTLPHNLMKPQGGKEVGYQNVAGGSDSGTPIDFYSRNLVLAFAARDIKLAANATTFTTKMTANAITYPGIVKSQFGLTLRYLPSPAPLEKQIFLCMVQILSVAADLIPAIGPLVGLSIYIGGNAIADQCLGEPI